MDAPLEDEERGVSAFGRHWSWAVILRKRHDYAACAAYEVLAVLCVLGLRFAGRHLGDYPAWFWLAQQSTWPIALVLGCVLPILSTILCWRHGLFPTVLGPISTAMWLVWKLLGSRLFRKVRSIDILFRSWFFAVPIEAFYLLLIVLALGVALPPSAAKALLPILCIGALYTIRVFGRWVSDPSYPLIGIWEFMKKGVGVDAQGKDISIAQIVAVLPESVTGAIKPYAALVSDKRAITTTFTSILLLVLIMVILAFAAIYKCLAIIDSDNFIVLGRHAPMLSTIDCLYFSVITLFTVGYGDIVPAAGWARFGAMCEVITGATLLIVSVASFTSAGIGSYVEGTRRAFAEFLELTQHRTHGESKSENDSALG